MYQIQTYVRYGRNGVFQIKDIVTKKLSAKERKQYYVLEGVSLVETRIVTPIDNPKLRAILTLDEIDELIAKMPQIPTKWIEDRRLRNEAFQAMIASNDAEKLVQVIKSIYLKKQEKEQMKKALSDEDMATLLSAEEILWEEIALSAGIAKDQVKPYILDKVVHQES